MKEHAPVRYTGFARCADCVNNAISPCVHPDPEPEPDVEAIMEARQADPDPAFHDSNFYDITTGSR